MVKTAVYQLVWDKEALSHLEEILNYLATQSNQAPKIVKTALFQRLDLIKMNPLICELDKLKYPPQEEFRAFTFFNYRLTFQIHTPSKTIRILRIRHTSREPLGY